MFFVRSRFLKAEGAWFDFDFFRDQHLPLIIERHTKYGLLAAEMSPSDLPDAFAVVAFMFRDEAGFCAALNDMEEILPHLRLTTNAQMEVKLAREGEAQHRELLAQFRRRARPESGSNALVQVVG